VTYTLRLYRFDTGSEYWSRECRSGAAAKRWAKEWHRSITDATFPPPELLARIENSFSAVIYHAELRRAGWRLRWKLGGGALPREPRP
jgi:hypothetical protein